MRSSAEIRALEENAEFLGVGRAQLMENAGKAAFERMRKSFDVRGKKVVVFCGPGNNGGDGFVLARHLASPAGGAEVKVLFLGNEAKLKDEARQAYWKLDPKLFLQTRELHNIHQAHFLIDAMLGLGFHANGSLREPLQSAARVYNKATGYKIALDVPTGVDADTGKRVPHAVEADEIYTFHDLKPGLQRFGRTVTVLDIGIPAEAAQIIGPGDVLRCAKKRVPDSHKGQNGVALVVGGSNALVGAPALSAQAALAAMRTGIDLVTVAAPEKVAWVVNSFSPDLMTTKLRGPRVTEEHLKEVLALAAKADAVLMGPGMGLDKETIAFVRKAVAKIKKPLVLDADALKAAKGTKFNGRVLITPHAKEFEIFSGRKLPAPANLKKRVKVVEEVARKHHCVVLLKGRVDIVSDGKATRLNKTGNPGMTIGGTGDVLAGLCLGLAAKGNTLFDAACAAAYLNGKAGDILLALQGTTFLASDLLRVIPKLLKKGGFT